MLYYVSIYGHRVVNGGSTVHRGVCMCVSVCVLMGNHIVTNRFTEERNNKMKNRRTFIGTVRHVSGGVCLLQHRKHSNSMGGCGWVVGDRFMG